MIISGMQDAMRQVLAANLTEEKPLVAESSVTDSVLEAEDVVSISRVARSLAARQKTQETETENEQNANQSQTQQEPYARMYSQVTAKVQETTMNLAQPAEGATTTKTAADGNLAAIKKEVEAARNAEQAEIAAKAAQSAVLE